MAERSEAKRSDTNTSYPVFIHQSYFTDVQSWFDHYIHFVSFRSLRIHSLKGERNKGFYSISVYGSPVCVRMKVIVTIYLVYITFQKGLVHYRSPKVYIVYIVFKLVVFIRYTHSQRVATRERRFTPFHSVHF